MKTSIVILTYNKLEYTKMCIDSIKKYTPKWSYEIIVVDNHSTDGTVEWLKEQKNIKTIFNSENMGFPKGCNQGIEIATGENILLLNNDVIVTHNWLENLERCLYSSDDIGAVGAVTNNCSYYQAISVNYKSIDEMQDFARNFNISNPDKWEERLKLIGFCMLFKREVADKIGLLDERFTPGNYEDDDYSLRIRKAGYRLILCQDTFIHHFGSVSFGENKDRYINLLQVNKQKFIEKWGFDPHYYTSIRHDLISLLTAPKDQEINVLEIGCACGATLLKIKSLYKNAKLYGIELNEGAGASASLFADVKITNVEKDTLDYPEGFFDYIILGEVLEHLIDPWLVLKKLRTHLKHQGQIIASVPNVMHFSIVRNLLNGYWTYEDAGILDRTHMRFFTLNEIGRMFTGAGYTDLEFKGVTVPMTESDDKFIKGILTVTNAKNEEQLKTYQYLVKASSDISHDIKLVITNIINEENLQENIEILNKYPIGQILEIICTHFENNLVDVLNLIAIKNFEYEYFDFVLPYLNKAYEFNPINQDTLYNLGQVLKAIGETDIAAKYFGKIRNEAAVSCLDQKDNNKTFKEGPQYDRQLLTFLLRRIENKIEQDESLSKVITALADNEITYSDIIDIVHSNLIEKEVILNLLAVMCYQEQIFNPVIPLLKGALKINKNHKDTLYNIGYMLFQAGENNEALKFLEQINDKDEEVSCLIHDIKEKRNGCT